MLKIEELKQTIEKRFGICTYWTDHLGKDCIQFKNNGYVFDIYIDYLRYAKRNMYMLQIDNEKHTYGIGYDFDNLDALFEMMKQFMKLKNVQGRLF